MGAKRRRRGKGCFVLYILMWDLRGGGVGRLRDDERLLSDFYLRGGIIFVLCIR